ncbi:MAG TPA: methyltransferase domain-containing protein [Anaerolineae bacterium]|nr:methyltransferase domain-containing protein [Anaerolineae bacterium]HQH37335.1 methyltransferase domain-containing protein [Anaerolineae bacterium]
MPTSKISVKDIGTSTYYEMLHQEADFWERRARGEVDMSLAATRDPELAAAVAGDLLIRTLNLAASRGSRILELACAEGELSQQLAQRGCLVDGIDISFSLVSAGMRRFASSQQTDPCPGKIRLFVGDLNRLGMAADTYDVVLAIAAFHHVLDLPSLVVQIKKTLKPGGALICLDHMEPSFAGRLLRYLFLLMVPTEVPYWRKPLHIFNRLMARVYQYLLPRRRAPAAFTLPPRSPFEDISGSEAVALIREHFIVEHYETPQAFANVVAGHLRLSSHEREVKMARRLRRLDDWLVKNLGVRGETYFLVAHKPECTK